jgi:hypothetical protein
VERVASRALENAQPTPHPPLLVPPQPARPRPTVNAARASASPAKDPRTVAAAVQIATVGARTTTAAKDANKASESVLLT